MTPNVFSPLPNNIQETFENRTSGKAAREAIKHDMYGKCISIKRLGTSRDEW